MFRIKKLTKEEIQCRYWEMRSLNRYPFDWLFLMREKCPYCKKTISPPQNYENLVAKLKGDIKDFRKCSDCGLIVPIFWRFCPECGKRCESISYGESG